jgi:hypothetical protein
MTYLNTYEMVKQMRIALNEYDASYMDGTIVSGAHHNDRLLAQLNKAQRHLLAVIKKRIPSLFRVTESDYTVTSSVITLPDDFGVLELLRDSDGNRIYPLQTKDRRAPAQSGSDQFYYREGNYLKLDKAGITGTVELIYIKKHPDLAWGQAQSGSGAQVLVMASSAKAIADYYNGVTVENVTDEVVDVISDYTAGRSATVSGTWAEDEWYGTVSMLPEPFHQLILDLALLMERAENPLVQLKPQMIDYQLHRDQVDEAIGAFGQAELCQDFDELFEDLDTPIFGGGFMEM